MENLSDRPAIALLDSYLTTSSLAAAVAAIQHAADLCTEVPISSEISSRFRVSVKFGDLKIFQITPNSLVFVLRVYPTKPVIFSDSFGKDPSSLN